MKYAITSTSPRSLFNGSKFAPDAKVAVKSDLINPNTNRNVEMFVPFKELTIPPAKLRGPYEGFIASRQLSGVNRSTVSIGLACERLIGLD